MQEATTTTQKPANETANRQIPCETQNECDTLAKVPQYAFNIYFY